MNDDERDSGRRRALADTLPRPQPTPHPGDRDVVSSAPAATIAAAAHAAGSVNLDDQRLTEAAARQLIDQRFAAAGLAPQADYFFCHGALAVTLDGFDPARRVGYQFVSHADVDVVTDFDDTAAARLAELSAGGIAHVLIVHDHEAPTPAELDAAVDAFLARHAP